MAIKGGSHTEKKSYSSSKDKNKQPPTKVVIRRLPPDMAADSFRDQVAPLPEHDHLCFVPADPGLAPHAFSRAYVNFTSLADVITFRDRFDGYVFVDKQGFEYPAVVEFAPYQRTPRRRSRKPDAKSGTILDDPDYKAFLAASEQPEPESAAPSWEQTLEEIERRHSEMKDTNVVTPLVTYVCKRRAEKKEERRRRELEKKKEETRKVREKLLAKEKRDTRERVRYDSKESAKTFREEDKDRRREDALLAKKYEKYLQDDKPKDKYVKEFTSQKYAKETFKPDKEDKYDKYKRKDKDERRKEDVREKSFLKEDRDKSSFREDRWKEDVREKPKREERTRTYSREERRRDADWEDKRKRSEKRTRTSEARSEASASASASVSSGRDCRDRPAEPAGDRSSDRSAESRAGGDAAPARRQPADARRERGDARPESANTGLKNKDRPSLAIYRPGMGKYSSRRLKERDSDSPAAGGGGEEGVPGEERGPPQSRDGRTGAALPRTLVFRRSKTAAE